MKPATLLPCIAGIRIKRIAGSAESIIVHLSAVAPAAYCPLCGHRFQRVHSHYQRTLADLPWNRVAVRLYLSARKFYCDYAECARRILTETLPESAVRYARKTNRLQEVPSLIGYALGGEVGASVAAGSGFCVSADTLLNCIRQVGVTASSESTVRVLGVDDRVFRKGRRYGTIPADPERRRVIDLLPDRSAESLAAWLQHHPEVEIVSRDRAGAYAEAAREGAPQAKQVADRFHLLKNAGDLLERVLTRHYRQLRETTKHLAAEQATVEPVPLSASPLTSQRLLTCDEQESACRRERCLARYERVVEWHQQGRSQRAIARTTGFGAQHRSQVARGQNLCRTGPSPGAIRQADALHGISEAALGTRRARAAQLLAEIQAQGFTGSIVLVRCCLQPWRRQSRAHPQKIGKSRPLPYTVLWWLLGYFSKTEAALRRKQTQFVEHLCQLCPEVKAAQERVPAVWKWPM